MTNSPAMDNDRLDAALTMYGLIEAALRSDDAAAIELAQPWTNNPGPLIRQFTIAMAGIIASGVFGPPDETLASLRAGTLYTAAQQDDQ